jgi:hypothetical protein
LHVPPEPQVVPVGLFVKDDVLMAGWQLWQGFIGLGAPEAYTPPSIEHAGAQTPPVQRSPPPQLAPLARLVHVVVPVAGWQVWHAFAGFAAPEEKTAPAMKQPAMHAAPLQTSPEPQLAPFVPVHCEVVVAGWQLWQMFAGFGAPEA